MRRRSSCLQKLHSNQMADVAALIAFARTWLGVPFKKGGRSRSGTDCVGFYLESLRALGALPAHFDDRTENDLLRGCTQWFRLAPIGAGSLLLFRSPRGTRPVHAALLTGPTIIHANPFDSVREIAFCDHHRRLVHSAWRAPSIDYRESDHDQAAETNSGRQATLQAMSGVACSPARMGAA